MSWKEYSLRVLTILIPYLIGWHQKQPAYMTPKAVAPEEKEEG